MLYREMLCAVCSVQRTFTTDLLFCANTVDVSRDLRAGSRKADHRIAGALVFVMLTTSLSRVFFSVSSAGFMPHRRNRPWVRIPHRTTHPICDRTLTRKHSPLTAIKFP